MQQPLPRVSIGIITYNHQSFIGECLESVIRQTYPHFEVVIADDCSTDDTYAIALAYQKKYPEKIKQVIRSPQNLGMAKNANQLLRALDADYIAMFAGDDVMHPMKIERQMALMLAHPDASFCYTNMEWFNSETNRKICNHYGLLQQPSDQLVRVIRDNCVSTNTLLMRRACVPAQGFDETVPFLHDLLFVVGLFEKGKPVYTREVLGRYRRHKGNITSTHFFAEDRFLLLDRFKQRFRGEAFESALKHFEALAYYGLIRGSISQGKKREAISYLPRIFPYCFTSVKWLARVALIARDLIFR